MSDEQSAPAAESMVRDLARAVSFGADVERFLTSSIGRYLVDHAERQIETAMEDFRQVNPTDHAAIVEIQVRLRVADSVQAWLADAVAAGHEAARVFEQSGFTD